MATRKELIAANLTIDEICAKIGADSLGYLSVEGLISSIGRKRREMCLGCLTGEYPETAKGDGEPGVGRKAPEPALSAAARR
jgi:amidophosphoribosyltransferase